MTIIFCSRQAGHRFGEHMERVTPLIEQYSRNDDDELREYCLQVMILKLKLSEFRFFNNF